MIIKYTGNEFLRRRRSEIRVPHYDTYSAELDMTVLLSKELDAMDSDRKLLTDDLNVAHPSVEHRIRLRLFPNLNTPWR